MNSESIMNSDVLDILFEKRNKSYGAYTLRKFYNQRLIKSVLLMLTIVSFLCAFTFLPTKKEVEAKMYSIPADPVFRELKKNDEKRPIMKPRAVQVQPPVSTVKLLSSITIVDSSEKIIDLGKKAIGSITQLTTVTGTPHIFTPPGPGGPPAISAVVNATTEDSHVPTEVYEVAPAFPGGMNALRQFMERQLNNPRELEEDELIKVKIRFVVGYDGKLKSFEIVEDGGAEFNNEVIRVLKKMPDWIPGKANGKNVSVYYTMPVKFLTSR